MVEYTLNPFPETYVDLWVKMVKELGLGETPNSEWFVDQMSILHELERFVVVVAVKDGETIGFCNVLLTDDPATGKVIGYGMHLYMLPEYRGGVETDVMFRKMEALSYEKGAEIIRVQCYSEMKRFWERQGFKQHQFVMERG